MALAVIDEHVNATLPAVRIAEHAVRQFVDRLEPDSVPLGDATAMWQSFDQIERIVSGAKTLLAARVEQSGDWKRAGARSAVDHLARLGATSARAAQLALHASKELPGLPVVALAMRAGLLSQTQVEVIVPAAAADPSAVPHLLGLAKTANVTELRAACLRTKVKADPDPDATHARIHAERYGRTFTDAEGAWKLDARGTADKGARFEVVLNQIVNVLFHAAREAGRNEPREAYVFDALMILAEQHNQAPEGDGKPSRPNPRFLGIMQISLEALVRGAVEGEDMCEIIGVGPIPIRIAREMLGDAILKLVITNGVDVLNVTHLGRGATAAQRVALLWSMPKCANETCSRMLVEIDHNDPWAKKHQTKLGNLEPLCGHDHGLKTNEGWSLVEGKGRRAFVGPKDPRHPRNKPPP
jgi:hypothetical protein